MLNLQAKPQISKKILAWSYFLDLIHCPRLAPPINGHVVGLNKGSDDVMIVACNQGTQMIGPEIRVCQRNVTWTGGPTYCK